MSAVNKYCCQVTSSTGEHEKINGFSAVLFLFIPLQLCRILFWLRLPYPSMTIRQALSGYPVKKSAIDAILT